MSARAASWTPDNHSPGFPSPHHKAAKRRKRPFAVALLLVGIVFLACSGILLFCPPVLEAMSAMVLPPQNGAIAWNGHDRITVVAMGLTQRTTEPARTDTLLAMDIDPARHHIAMLSVPRDLWVKIPGYGHGKLAIAYAAGGPKLAAYTLERELGIPVDYTIAMTFRGFMKLIDAMGGVDVTVPRELKDPTYPCLVGYAYCPIDIKPGKQHMDGSTALEFVRERHAFAQQDLARVQDQQAFSDAVKHTLMSPFTWPRYPAILSTLKDSLITDVPYNVLPEFGAQFLLTSIGGIEHSYINLENGLVQTGWSNDGQSILQPTDAVGIPRLVHRLFSDPRISQENASIAVLNGTGTSGVAGDVQTTLQGLGYRVVATANADGSTYRQCQVIVNTAFSGAEPMYTARRLQRMLNATLVKRSISTQNAQVVVIAGSDLPASGG